MFKYVILALIGLSIYFGFYFDAPLSNELIGQVFVITIFSFLLFFAVFKFGLHYKIRVLNRFSIAFYYAVFEYKKVQKKPSGLSFMDSVREQAEVALAANFDPTLKTADLKIPVTMYTGKDPFLKNLRAKIQEAEKLKLKARHLDGKANVIIGKTKQDLAEKNLTTKPPQGFLDRMFETERSVAAIIDLTTSELQDHPYDIEPDYEILTRIAFDNNPHIANTYKFFDSEDILNVLQRAPFMVILMGIIGTFAGFYLALSQGGDIKSGAAIAIISSLVGLPVSLFMDYINTLFADKSRYQQSFDKYKVSLEILFNHERELAAAAKSDKQETATV